LTQGSQSLALGLVLTAAPQLVEDLRSHEARLPVFATPGQRLNPVALTKPLVRYERRANQNREDSKPSPKNNSSKFNRCVASG